MHRLCTFGGKNVCARMTNINKNRNSLKGNYMFGIINIDRKELNKLKIGLFSI